MKMLRLLTASALLIGVLAACNADPTAPVAPSSVRAGHLSIPGTGPVFNGGTAGSGNVAGGGYLGTGNYTDEDETQTTASGAVAADSMPAEKWKGIFGSGN